MGKGADSKGESMLQEELKAAVDAMKAAEPPEPPAIILPSQTQGNLQERTVQAKAAEPGGPPLAPGKKVAILGFTDSYKLAPFADPSWEIWGLNELYMMIPRWSRWFEIHSRAVYEADKKRTSDHIYALRAMTCPVYMQQHWDDIPGSVPYPLMAIAQMFPNPGVGGKPYLTNSISYMLALAIAEGFNEIAVFGVDMAHSSEYCLSAETRVLTADLRWIPIGETFVGQELVAFDEDTPDIGRRAYRKSTIEAIQRLTQPCYRLHLEDGTKIIASDKHRWLVGDHGRRWLETSALQASDTAHSKSSKLLKLFSPWETDKSWESGYLAAAYDGEGHFFLDKRDKPNSAPMALRFTQRKNGMSAAVEKALDAKHFKYARSTMSHKDALDYSIRGGRSEIMRFLGTLRPERLMQKFDADLVGKVIPIARVPIVHKEFIGEHPVIGLKTSTRTFVAEGFASHNSHQRPSCEYFLGIAQGRGIKVTIPPECELLKTDFLYGFEQELIERWDARMKAREADLNNKISQADTQIAQLTEARAQYRGAFQDTQHLRQNWQGLFRST